MLKYNVSAWVSSQREIRTRFSFIVQCVLLLTPLSATHLLGRYGGQDWGIIIQLQLHL